MSKSETLRQQLQPNSIIMSNTSLIEASRIIELGEDKPSNPERGRSYTSAIGRLIEFCNITEAVVLNDSIYTLPSIDPPDISSKSLVHLLREANICRDLPTLELSQKAIDSSLTLLGAIGNSRVYQSAIPYIEAKSWIPGIDNDEDYHEAIWADANRERTRKFEPTGLIPKSELTKRLEGRFLRTLHSSSQQNSTTEDSLSNFFELFRRNLHYQVSPNTSYVIHIIRNVLYWVTAEHYQISYFPDLARTEWTSEWTKIWQESLSQKVYSVVAKAFQEDVAQVMEDEQPLKVFLPLVAAIVLSKASQVSDIPNALLEVREEFSSFRSQFSELEYERRNAMSIIQRRKIKKKIEELLKVAAKKSNVQEERFFVSAIGYTDEVADIIKSPTDPNPLSSFKQS